MVNLRKPDLEVPATPLREPAGLIPRTHEIHATPIAEIIDIKEDVIIPQHIIGRIERVPAPAECSLEEAFLLASGQRMIFSAGSDFVVFQQQRDGIAAKAFHALETIEIHGPAAYMPIKASNLTEEHLALIQKDDNSQAGSFLSDFPAWVIPPLLFVGLLEGIGAWISSAPMVYLLKGLAILCAAALINEKYQSAWRERGEKAKKRINDRIMTDLELFLPHVLKKHVVEENGPES